MSLCVSLTHLLIIEWTRQHGLFLSLPLASSWSEVNVGVMVVMDTAIQGSLALPLLFIVILIRVLILALALLSTAPSLLAFAFCIFLWLWSGLWHIDLVADDEAHACGYHTYLERQAQQL